MIPLAQLEAITEVAHTAVAALLAMAALSRESARPAELGPLAWLAVFDDDDRAEFFGELRDALAVAEATRDAAPVETCLREWRTTAAALADPQQWPGSWRLPAAHGSPPARRPGGGKACVPGPGAPPVPGPLERAARPGGLGQRA